MAERNYLKTEAVFLTEKTPKKEVVVTPPLREDSLTVTENGTYQAPIGRGYTDVEVNVSGAEPLLVTLTKNPNDEYFTADKTNSQIYVAMTNKTPVYLVENGTIIIVNMGRIINPTAQESRFKATVPNFGILQTYADTFDNTTWEAIEDKTIFWVNLEWNNDLGNYVANKTNGEIINALTEGLIPYISFQLHGYPDFANFMFALPIMLEGRDDTNGLSLFQSQIVTRDIMGIIYSDDSLPLDTNTNWHFETMHLATQIYVDETAYFGIDLLQPTAGSDNFMCSQSASEIIFGTGADGGYRIPYVSIKLKTSSFPRIHTRNLVAGDNGLLCIIYYDPEENAVCKLMHLPTDVEVAWTRSTV